MCLLLSNGVFCYCRPYTQTTQLHNRRNENIYKCFFICHLKRTNFSLTLDNRRKARFGTVTDFATFITESRKDSELGKCKKRDTDLSTMYYTYHTRYMS